MSDTSNIENENTNNQDQSNKNKTTDITKLLESEEVKSYLNKLVEEQTKSLKDKNKELLDELKPLKTKLKEDVTLKLLSEGKHEEVFSKVKEERDNEWKEILSNKEKEFLSEKEQLLKYKEKVEEFSYKEKFNEIASNTRLNKSAYKDAIKELKSEFIIDESGELKHKENKINSNGKPFSVNDWLDLQVKERSFWFDGVSGAGTKTQQSSLVNNNVKLSAEEIKKLSVKEYKEMKKKGLI